jgi:hypothetical protein
MVVRGSAMPPKTGPPTDSTRADPAVIETPTIDIGPTAEWAKSLAAAEAPTPDTNTPPAAWYELAAWGVADPDRDGPPVGPNSTEP